jgi:hypothetical protein
MSNSLLFVIRSLEGSGGSKGISIILLGSLAGSTPGQPECTAHSSCHDRIKSKQWAFFGSLVIGRLQSMSDPGSDKFLRSAIPLSMHEITYLVLLPCYRYLKEDHQHNNAGFPLGLEFSRLTTGS